MAVLLDFKRIIILLSLQSNINRNIFEQAKPETVDKVCEIVRKQLAIQPDVAVTGDSKFAALGADSLDTVCITNFQFVLTFDVLHPFYI